jgi:hypothetical protein
VCVLCDSTLDVGSSMSELSTVKVLDHIQDSNSMQTFEVEGESNGFHRFARIKFTRGSDFYCRITIYQLIIEGQEKP